MRLSDYLAVQGITAAEFGRRVGVTRQDVHRWLGGAYPRREAVARISRVTNGAVTANDFVLPEQARAS